MAAAGEAQMSAAQQALKGLSVAEAMETRFTPISIDATLNAAVDALLSTAQHEFPVVDAFKSWSASYPRGHFRRRARPWR